MKKNACAAANADPHRHSQLRMRVAATAAVVGTWLASHGHYERWPCPQHDASSGLAVPMHV